MTRRELRTADDLDALAFDREGLVPVVAQDAITGRVLMVAWADRDALERGLGTGQMHYWSRSRQELWHKGATSGNVQRIRSLHADCDGDTVLALVEPSGPACHTGSLTCFGSGAAPVLHELWDVLRARRGADPAESYTARLLDDENLRTKKLGEESAELLRALVKADPPRIREEAADLFYHVMTSLLAAGVTLDEVLAELASRRNRSSRNG